MHQSWSEKQYQCNSNLTDECSMQFSSCSFSFSGVLFSLTEVDGKILIYTIREICNSIWENQRNQGPVLSELLDIIAQNGSYLILAFISDVQVIPPRDIGVCLCFYCGLYLYICGSSCCFVFISKPVCCRWELCSFLQYWLIFLLVLLIFFIYIIQERDHSLQIENITSASNQSYMLNYYILFFRRSRV